MYLVIDHTWVGDLVVSLQHEDSGHSITLLDRPGIPDREFGCSNNNIISILDDKASQPAEDKCASSPAAISGTFQPHNWLNAFRGETISGDWSLHVSDNFQADTGSLREWCLEVTIGDSLPPPDPTPTPVYIPARASVDGMHGEDQALPLDCESRSAVDWATHFGYQIDEFEFFYNLPTSDNPDAGFVGDVHGTWGQIPPNDYGVHALPVANLLRTYGLTASAHRSLNWDDLRAEIASGHPVIVWVTGPVINGVPRYYTAQSDNHTTVVAPYEHTVIVTGYTESNVTILDGDSFYTRSLDQFLDSWSVLRNMAILARP